MISNGYIIDQSIKGLYSKLIAIHNALVVLRDANDDPLLNRATYFNVEGVDNPDFKFSGCFFNNGGVGVAGERAVRFCFSGPYGSHLDADLLHVEHDSLENVLTHTTNNITLISTVARLALFIDEMHTYVTGLAAYPATTVVIPK